MVRLIAYVHGNRERGFSLCLKLGLHKKIFILTLMNEISKIPLNHIAGSITPRTPPNLSFAPQKKSTSLNDKCYCLIPFHFASLRHLPIFLHMSFRSNMIHILQHLMFLKITLKFKVVKNF